MSNRNYKPLNRLLAILVVAWAVLHLVTLLLDVIKHSNDDKKKPKASWEQKSVAAS